MSKWEREDECKSMCEVYIFVRWCFVMNGRYKVHWERDEPKKKKNKKNVVKVLLPRELKKP